MIYSPLTAPLSLQTPGCPHVVILDSRPSFHSYIESFLNSTFIHLKNISRPCPSLPGLVAERLIQTLISSHLDYCNGATNNVLDRLQYVQKSSRIPAAPTLLHLPWLPVKFHIRYKILILAYQSLHALAPQFLPYLLHLPANSGLLVIPYLHLQSFGYRAFSAVAPTVWNSLT